MDNIEQNLKVQDTTKQNNAQGPLSSFAQGLKSASSAIASVSRPKKRVNELANYKSLASSVKNKVYQPQTQNQSIAPDFASLGVITTPYGGSTKFESGGSHKGIDIANKIGTPIKAFAGGKVVSVSSGQKNTPNKGGWGNSVVIQDDNGNYWRYSHLNESWVKAGQYIPRGTVFSSMGNSGGAYSTSGGTGSHLDLRVYNAAKKYLNPLEYYNSLYKKNG